MTQDQSYIQRCLQLAENGRGTVAPNPMVGAVLVYRDRIMAEGWTQPYGGAHAEVQCLSQVAEEDEILIAESTLYVSLEPCSHFGKTPPCADLIIAKHIKKLVIGCKDTAAHVNGSGIEKLRAAGVEVVVGILEADCMDFNKRFFTFQQKKRPFILLKWAQSADGYLAAQGKKTKITSQEIDVIVHKWRSEEAAIMVGTNTALIDNPQLNARYWNGKQPTRIVIDKKLSIPQSYNLYDQTTPTIFLNEKLEEKKGQHTFIKIDVGDDNFLAKSLERLFELGVLSVLVEGGKQLLDSFIQQNLWDETRMITNNDLLLVEGLFAPKLLKGTSTQELVTANHSIKFYQNK